MFAVIVRVHLCRRTGRAAQWRPSTKSLGRSCFLESFHANNSTHMTGNHILLCQASFHEAVSTHCLLYQFQISKKRTYKYLWVRSHFSYLKFETYTGPTFLLAWEAAAAAEALHKIHTGIKGRAGTITHSHLPYDVLRPSCWRPRPMSPCAWSRWLVTEMASSTRLPPLVLTVVPCGSTWRTSWSRRPWIKKALKLNGWMRRRSSVTNGAGAPLSLPSVRWRRPGSFCIPDWPMGRWQCKKAVTAPWQKAWLHQYVISSTTMHM